MIEPMGEDANTLAPVGYRARVVDAEVRRALARLDGWCWRGPKPAARRGLLIAESMEGSAD